MASSNARYQDESVARARYVAQVQRRQMPPRCNPITIVVMVLASGTVFIGATMTMIAHWPGSSSIGENPLKIAGPILLAVGAAAVIIDIVVIGVLNSQEREKWLKSMQNITAARAYESTAKLSHHMDDDAESQSHSSTE